MRISLSLTLAVTATPCNRALTSIVRRRYGRLPEAGLRNTTEDN